MAIFNSYVKLPEGTTLWLLQMALIEIDGLPINRMVIFAMLNNQTDPDGI